MCVLDYGLESCHLKFVHVACGFPASATLGWWLIEKVRLPSAVGLPHLPGVGSSFDLLGCTIPYRTISIKYKPRAIDQSTRRRPSRMKMSVEWLRVQSDGTVIIRIIGVPFSWCWRRVFWVAAGCYPGHRLSETSGICLNVPLRQP